jgi:hypothetical protein
VKEAREATELWLARASSSRADVLLRQLRDALEGQERRLTERGVAGPAARSSLP